MGSGLWGRLRRVEGFIRLVAGGWGGRSCLGTGGRLVEVKGGGGMVEILGVGDWYGAVRKHQRVRTGFRFAN